MSDSLLQSTHVSEPPLLRVSDLTVNFDSELGTVHAVNGINFGVDYGETLAIVGESGSGKTVSFQALLALLATPPARVSGSALFRGVDLLKLSQEELRKVRGRQIAVVSQNAMSALDPSFRVGYQIAEMYRVHLGMSWREANVKAIEMLDAVGIPSPRERARDYPHEFSGGMQQRVMIAIALALDPVLLIADEPTTALDVTIQAQIMELLASMRDERRMGLVLITHDLALVPDVADFIAIMYAGRIVEVGTVQQIYEKPSHPYTAGLIRSIPGVVTRADALEPIPGRPPDPFVHQVGCSFAPRCEFAASICFEETPLLLPLADGRDSACHFAQELANA